MKQLFAILTILLFINITLTGQVTPGGFELPSPSKPIDFDALMLGKIQEQVQSVSENAYWSQSHFYKVAGKTFLFCHTKGNGRKNMVIREVKNDGKLGRYLQEEDWVWDWEQTRFFTSGGNTYFFQHTKDSRTNNMQIRKVNSNGTLGAVIQSEDWAAFWGQIEFFHTEGKTFFYQHSGSLKENNVRIRSVGNDGKLGRVAHKENRSAYWSQTHFYSIGGKTYLFRHYNGSKGNASIFPVNKNGSLGKLVKAYDWTWYWEKTDFFTANGKLYFYQHTKDSKENNLRITEVKNDGSLGKLTHRENSSAYWAQNHFYIANGGTYLFRHSPPIKKGGTLVNKNNAIVLHITKDGKLSNPIQSLDYANNWSKIDIYDVDNQLFFYRHTNDTKTDNIQLFKIKGENVIENISFLFLNTFLMYNQLSDIAHDLCSTPFVENLIEKKVEKEVEKKLKKSRKPIPEYRAQKIGEEVKRRGYDIISLSEVWKPKFEDIIRNEINQFSSYDNIKDGLCESGGLITFFTGKYIRYKEEGFYNESGDDAMSMKGILFIELELGKGLPNMEVYSTHLNAGDYFTKFNQLIQLTTFFHENHNNKNIAILSGDFNIDADSKTKYTENELFPRGTIVGGAGNDHSVFSKGYWNELITDLAVGSCQLDKKLNECSDNNLPDYPYKDRFNYYTGEVIKELKKRDLSLYDVVTLLLDRNLGLKDLWKEKRTSKGYTNITHRPDLLDNICPSQSLFGDGMDVCANTNGGSEGANRIDYIFYKIPKNTNYNIELTAPWRTRMVHGQDGYNIPEPENGWSIQPFGYLSDHLGLETNIVITPKK